MALTTTASPAVPTDAMTLWRLLGTWCTFPVDHTQGHEETLCNAGEMAPLAPGGPTGGGFLDPPTAASSAPARNCHLGAERRRSTQRGRSDVTGRTQLGAARSDFWMILGRPRLCCCASKRSWKDSPTWCHEPSSALPVKIRIQPKARSRHGKNKGFHIPRAPSTFSEGTWTLLAPT